MRRMFAWGAATVAAAMVLIVVWAVLAPGWAVRLLGERAALDLGRELTVKGGAHVEFSPHLAIRLDGVSLANPADPDSPFLTAESLRLPVSPWQLLVRQADLAGIALDSPEIALLINEQGKASWDFPMPAHPTPFRVTIDHGTLRYFDARNAQSFAISGVTLSADISAAGELTLKGSADAAGRLLRIDGYVKSVSRVQQDGSPANLELEAPDLALSFDGRISTATVLGLAGTLSLSSDNPVAAARWAGIDVDAEGLGSLHLSGGLESAGRAFALHQAEVALGGNTASGDVALDFRNEVAKLQASLQSAAIDLAPFIPASGAKPGAWGTQPLGLARLKVFDAELSLSARSLAYGALTTGPSQIHVAIDKGRLDATLVASTIAGGQARVGLAVDGGVSPPGFAIGLKCEDVDAAKLLPGLAETTWLKGRGLVSASLSGSGDTQQEIVGSLQGTIDAALANGEVSGFGVSEALSAVSQHIVEGWPSAAVTPFSKLTVSAAISDGIGTLTSLNLQSPTLTLTGMGEIDILRRSLDLKVDPRLKTGGADAGLPVAVAVSGPWTGPRLYPDLPDILKHPDSAFDKLKSMGLPAAAN